MNNIKLVKGMTKCEVNDLIEKHGRLHDEIYLGNSYSHNWVCDCGNIIKNKTWSTIKRSNLIKCDKCKYNETEQRYKHEVEKDGEYEYIRSFRRGDRLPNSKIVGDSPYIQIKHKYCGNIYETQAAHFINSRKRCGKCCGSYENSFAYYIEQELREPLEKYWDFDKNTVNPYLISKKTDVVNIWIKCTEVKYHGSYNTNCYIFYSGCKCPYCNPFASNKVHPLDSFGYKHFDKAQSWHPDNKISPFRVALNSGKKYRFVCPECNHEWDVRLADINHGQWCPQCASSKGEQKITKWLRINNINFIPQKEFDGLIGLGGGNLSYDFYLPDYNLLIEYQGEFHDGTARQQTEEQFKKQKEHDKKKCEYAKGNNINLLEIWYWDFNNIEEILRKQILRR